MTVYYKMQQILLQNAIANLLQNATEVYYKMRQAFCYKMRHLLQNATFITNCDSTYRNNQTLNKLFGFLLNSCLLEVYEYCFK